MARHANVMEEPHPQEQPEPATATRPRLRQLLLPILIILLGMSVLLYPVIATQWNNIQQQLVTEEYAKFVEEQPEEVRNEMFEAALRYNAEHTGTPILDPWLAQVAEDNGDYQAYLEQLKTNGAMAQIIVPSAKVKLPVYHGSDEKTLQKGVGHLFGTSLPVGGTSTHSVLTGHTGLTNATLFDNLTDVTVGDAIYLNVLGNRLKYEVNQLNVVLPNEIDQLAVVEGQDLVTLITCTPYGINSHRLLVRGHRVPMEPADEKLLDEQGGLTWQWWMLAAIGACALVLVLMLVWVIRAIRRNRRAEPTEEVDSDDQGN